jgi:serine/threonine-protein kinase RsbW
MSPLVEERNAVTVGAGHAVRLTIPARPEFIGLTRLALTGLSRVRDLPDDVVADLKLAITEACSNSVRHAYPGGDGTVDVLYELRPDRLVVEVADDGEGFDPDREESEAGDLSEGGLGIAIIRAISDQFEIGTARNGRGSRLRFEKLFE